ncbi:undecaprenyl-phosphate glucose phosphotransferase [Mucilaginibacter robiniae]|uniref:Undecaprenyl-phosphate glucose phosphotransferase n=1 Tax=Mucilaginibacter robiniae TaxID=2728022 RepID=A0A7L5DTI1_9SPHI|nr:undecaprenyl-phosphate glucose phosphotransferase [Mucilaginibacter robiniae]QJD94415.1 undecaprenyl-phosphate glucose phosphotransferase [Mucilaginibacter robiniae]
MQNRYLYTLRFVLGGVDFVCINIVFLMAYYFTSQIQHHFVLTNYLQLLIANNLLWVISASCLHLYHKKTVFSSKTLFALRWKCGVMHVLWLGTIILMTNQLQAVYLFLLLLCLLLNLHLIFSQLSYHIVEPLLKQRFKFKKPIALLGITPNSAQLASFLKSKNAKYNLNRFLDEHECLMMDETPVSLADTREQIRKAADNGINEVYVALTPDRRMADIEELIKEAHNQCIRLCLVPDYSYSFTKNTLSAINPHAARIEEMQSRFIKRLFDLVFSSMVIIFILSWLYPILALIIKCQSPGPVLFKQLRSGRNNDEFWCYKFRSMRVNQTADQKQASKNDDRITPFGRFLRKSSLDELPQFFNVFLGDMSVVGPRPHMLKHTEQYRNLIDRYMARHYLKPGITGWAQVNGYRGETKEIPQMKKRVDYDLWYLDNWSVTLDVKIIYLTVANIINGEENAY